MATIVLGFGHKARQGKDEAVKAIIEARGGQWDVRRYAFADALKIEVNEYAEKFGGLFALFQALQNGQVPGAPELTMYDPAIDRKRPLKWEAEPDMTDPLCPLGKQRELLQWWGTEFRRNSDPFYWVRKTAERIAADHPQFALVPDMRFPNEAFWVGANEGYTIKVTRYGFPSINEHISERALNNFKFDIEVNVLDGELEQLKKDAVEVFDMIVGWNTPPNLKSDDFTEEAFDASQAAD
jgi:hypothetical protein